MATSTLSSSGISWLGSRLSTFSYFKTEFYTILIPLSVSWRLTIYVADRLGSSYAIIHTLLWWATVRFMTPNDLPYLSRFMKPLLYILCCQCFYEMTKPRKGSYVDKGEERKEVHALDEAREESLDEEILEPLLFPSYTTHRRLIPTQHSFGYSYLLAGVPVHDHDTNVNNLLSSHGGHVKPSPAWCSVHSSDYLQRGTSFTGSSLRHKLDIFLAEEDLTPNAFPYAYLVTAPRFLGWSFNPVSFWYLYNNDKVLSAMILEVNNTFDERRMYLLQNDPKSDATQSSDTEKFTAKWKKDFHVSPFNDRTGAYSVSVVDIAATRTVDVTIVLSDMDDKPKVIARIYSKYSSTPKRSESVIGPGIDPAIMSRAARLRFLLQHGWKGFFTNPRILRQAWTLWRKNLTVFFRPEPLLSTIGRNETREEVVVERFFRRVLQLMAQESRQNIRYTPAAGQDRGKIVHVVGKAPPGKGVSAEEKAKTLCLDVLSPQFYYELAIADSSLLTVFERFCFQAAENEVLVSISDPEALRHFLSTNIRGKLTDEIRKNRLVARKESGVLCLRSLKQSGLLQACKVLSEALTSRETTCTSSELDNMVSYVVQGISTTRLDQDEYSCAVFSILCADQFAFGSSILLGILQGLCRSLLTILLTGVMVGVYLRLLILR